MADMERRVLKRQTAVEVCNTGNVESDRPRMSSKITRLATVTADDEAGQKLNQCFTVSLSSPCMHMGQNGPVV